MTFASFQIFGTTLEESDLLKMMAIGSARIKANSFRIQFGILSGPLLCGFEAHRVCYKLHRVE
jgi:hypothetical protein